MRSRDKAGGKAGHTQRRKTATPKRRNAAKVARRRKSSTASATDRIALLTIERDEALEQQRATSEVLKVISSSPGELEPVFEAMLESALRICEAEFGMLMLHRGDGSFDTRVMVGAPPALVDALLHKSFTPPPGNPLDRMLRTKKTVHVIDAAAEKAKPPSARLAGARSHITVPMVKQNEVVGCISIYRTEVRPFTDKQIELVTSFAAQAAIAIENTRLFSQTREALERQTATAEVLRVIASSPTDVKPVLVAIVESVCKLCEASDAYVALKDGEYLVFQTQHGSIPVAWKRRPINRQWPAGRAVIDGKYVHLRDVLEREGDEFAEGREIARHDGARSVLAVPLMRKGGSIGVIILRRTDVLPFTDRQIGLLMTFADQAIIAIENARLFDEVQAKTRELTETLTYQTGSSNILRVIASSPTDVEPVLKAISESACELCEADDAVVQLREGDELRYAAHRGSIPVGLHRRAIDRNFIGGRAIVDRVPVHVHDVLSAEGDEFPESQQISRRVGTRTLLCVPMLREGESIGTILLRRTEVNPFSDRQIELVSSFASQAVIAIENARLFNEVQAKTRDLSEALIYQTGSSNILSVIASSPTDVAPVLQAIVKSACELCGAYDALVRLKVGDELQPSAHHGPIPASGNKWHINRDWSGGRAVIDKKPVHVHDALSAEADDLPLTRQTALQQGYRTSLSVPLLRGGESIGVIVLRRMEVDPFSDKQIALLQTFADQAVIAIGNVRMFEQVQQRTRELSQSLDDLRTAQERLIQTEKLASLGQLTAGIAHEIKNPLNFVNNFSALSAELIDEMKQALSDISLDHDKREELNEIARMLKDNLEKVVQHGKRADSIVKNMLQHSREGSGEHRPADINAIVDESMNLAYHGARAEKAGFSIAFQRDLDPSVGMADVYPQEITRVLLNLISNGFYAAAKRKAEAGDGFEPTLSAATKSLGDKVEIRIRDNGTGIPEEVKKKIFNPFFTTKPSGEGTGLGLSISHDIIVKQHGGSIDVETEPGLFTEFKIVLPRTSQR